MRQTRNNRKPTYQNYYDDGDYNDVLSKLPDIIKKAEIKAGEILEPTFDEKRKVMSVIRNFIKRKERKVYGGTAIDENIKNINRDDGIYDKYDFPDIEFYSYTPVSDLIELNDLLYQYDFKYIISRSAQHDETYSIYVNFQLYCDITYVPKRIYHAIAKNVINGIEYVHPHFILIDQLRILNQPLTAASQRWEKTFKRMFKMLHYYPLEYFGGLPPNIAQPSKEIEQYLLKIKSDFLGDPDIQNICLIGGFDAYNFYIRGSKKIINHDEPSRIQTGLNLEQIDKFLSNVNSLELISVSYRETVESIYNFIRSIVKDRDSVKFVEFFPLFQFNGYSVSIKYHDHTLVTIYDMDGFCVPSVRTQKGYQYVSYQYILMFMLINKFRAHLDKDQNLYKSYGSAVSNLVAARNFFLGRNNLSVINDTIFGEFKISCLGSTISYSREGHLKRYRLFQQNRGAFKYEPEVFAKMDEESRKNKIDAMIKYVFKNTSGNQIRNEKNLRFKFDEFGNIIKPKKTDDENDDDDNDNNEDDEDDDEKKK